MSKTMKEQFRSSRNDKTPSYFMGGEISCAHININYAPYRGQKRVSRIHFLGSLTGFVYDVGNALNPTVSTTWRLSRIKTVKVE